MTNQTIDPATLPPEARRRLKLIEEIRRVAEEIGYRGRGDSERLAQALDDRGIKPLRANIPSWKGYWGGKWVGVHPYSTQKLLLFIKRWLPGLLDHGAPGVVHSVPVVKVTCLCSKCGLSGTDACKWREETKREPSRHHVVPESVVPVTPVVPESVVSESEESATNVMGWTIFHDKKRNRYKAVRRTNGRLRSIYVGKSNDPELVREKIKAWCGQHREGT